MILTDEDHRWLRDKQPGLRDDSEGDKIRITGCFKFFAAHDELNSSYIKNPDERACQHLICLRDSYELEITGVMKSREFPKVREVGGRIKQRALVRGCKLRDLHIYEDGEACLVGPLDMELDMAFPDFLDRPVLQFFYDQSYHERYGCWPRGHYAHGVLGLFENYMDRKQDGGDDLADSCLEYLANQNTDPLRMKTMELLRRKKQVKGGGPCSCGSGRRFRDCHPKAFWGMWNVHQRIHLPPSRE